MPLWKCPQCQSQVRGPQRPRKNATCRFCLTCSARSKYLVERTCPVQDKKRDKRRAAQKAKDQKKAQKNREAKDAILAAVPAGLYEPLPPRCNDYLYQRAAEFWASPVLKAHHDGGPAPLVTIRWSRTRPGTTGHCYNCGFRNASVTITVGAPRQRFDVESTLLHELVHAALPPSTSHKMAFRQAFSEALEELLGVRIPACDTYAKFQKIMWEHAKIPYYQFPEVRDGRLDR